MYNQAALLISQQTLFQNSVLPTNVTIVINQDDLVQKPVRRAIYNAMYCP